MNNLTIIRNGANWLVLFIAAIFLSSCKFIQPTFGKYNIESLTPTDDGNFKIEVSMEVDNPNNYNIWVRGGKMDVTMGSEKVGTIKTKGTVVLKKQTRNKYVMKANTKMDKNSSVVNMIINGAMNKPVKVQGSIKAGVFIVGKKFNIDFSDKLPSINLFGN